MRTRRRSRQDYLLPTIGWLFADLLLALAVLFLISEVPPKLDAPMKVILTRTATPTPVPTITTDSLILDPNITTLNVTIDNPEALSSGEKREKDKLTRSIQNMLTQKGLQRRRAGIAFVSGGANNNQGGGIAEAQKISHQTYEVLASLGSHNFVFCHTVYYHDIYVYDNDPHVLIIEIFMFQKSAPSCI